MTTSKNSWILPGGNLPNIHCSSGLQCYGCATQPGPVACVFRHPVIQAQEKKDVAFAVPACRMFLQNLLDLREVKIQRKLGGGVQKNISDSFCCFEPAPGW